MAKNKVEQLATQYAENQNSCYNNDYYGFINGHKSAGKEINKTITDLKNKYKSWLHDAQHTKLTKITSEEQLIALKAKIDVLEELENKLKL